mgnify:FL=1|jgi:uracil-DNA glycosylase
MFADLPVCWARALHHELTSESFASLCAFVESERLHHAVFPPEASVFAALTATPLSSVRWVLLGQDPYHGEGQANGLCFSVPRDVAIPPSLRNILKELRSDLGVTIPTHGDLSSWAQRGALLLNTVLTVRQGSAASHAKRGWERLTDAAISAVSAQARPVVFVLWGKPAEAKLSLIDKSRHRVVIRAHPSPLSASRGFLGTRPFSELQEALQQLGQPPFDFSLPP